MDDLDKSLLSYIQKNFPLQKYPFVFLASKFTISEDEIISRLKYLKEEQQLIRNISGIFNSKKLGFKSALVAMHIKDDRLDEIAGLISESNYVSHNYSRDNYYNLWFTYTIPVKEDLWEKVKSFSEWYEIDDYMVLPAIRTFKSNVIFELSEDDLSANNSILLNARNSAEDDSFTSTALDKTVINLLQLDLPLLHSPFEEICKGTELVCSEFLEIANKYLANNIMKRYCATLRHYKAGFLHNGLLTWNIEYKDRDEIGNNFAAMEFVSHCYERPSSSKWPYNIYTMIHATSEDDFNKYIRQLIETSNNSEYKLLKTTKEYKKERIIYF